MFDQPDILKPARRLDAILESTRKSGFHLVGRVPSAGDLSESLELRDLRTVAGQEPVSPNGIILPLF
jgi:hypothetical protein